MRLAVDRHLAFFHRFEQCRLRFGRRAIDFVGENEIREDRAVPQRKCAGARIEDRGTDDVGRHQVGRELDAPKTDAEQPREDAHEQRFRRTGHAFEQQVSAGEQCNERAQRRAFVPRHHAFETGAQPLCDCGRFGLHVLALPDGARESRAGDQIAIGR